MDDNNQSNDDGLGQVDNQRRTAMFTMAKVLAYAPPVVATFAMGGLSAQAAHAYGGNM